MHRAFWGQLPAGLRWALLAQLAVTGGVQPAPVESFGGYHGVGVVRVSAGHVKGAGGRDGQSHVQAPVRPRGRLSCVHAGRPQAH